MTLHKDILDFLFPRHCVVCNTTLSIHEKSICTSCLLHLPRTDYHLVEHSPLEKFFWTQFPIEKAVSFFHHDGNKVRSIIYALKYHANPNTGIDIGHIYAQELQAESDFFSTIDCIIPMPLHWMRQLKRSYNQSYYIAKGISQSTSIPIYNNVVKRIKNNPSQTQKNHTERKTNVANIFKLTNPTKIAGKHILLIDDVVTTGSTITSCAIELSKAPNVRISILTLAIASRTPSPTSPNDIPDSQIFGMLLTE